MTSSVCSPTEPVQPRMATPIMAGSSWNDLQADQREHQRRRGSGDAVDAIEHAAVPGKYAAAVFEAHGALEHALGQITHHRQRGDRNASHHERPHLQVEYETR